MTGRFGRRLLNLRLVPCCNDKLVPEGPTKIAQRFSVGYAVRHRRLTSALQPSLRDLPLLRFDPNAEALGYCQTSLRDEDLQKSTVCILASVNRHPDWQAALA